MAVLPVVDTGLIKQIVERNDPSSAKSTIYDAWTFEEKPNPSYVTKMSDSGTEQVMPVSYRQRLLNEGLYNEQDASIDQGYAIRINTAQSLLAARGYEDDPNFAVNKFKELFPGESLPEGFLEGSLSPFVIKERNRAEERVRVFADWYNTNVLPTLTGKKQLSTDDLAVAEANNAIDKISGNGTPSEQGIAKGFDWSRLFKIMAGMPAAEMAYPYQGTPATAFAVSSQQVDAAEAAAAQEELKRQNELAKVIAGIKPVKPPGITAESVDLVNTMLLPKNINPYLQKMKTLMLESTTEGGWGGLVGGLKNIATFIGLGNEAAGKSQIKEIVALIKANIAASGMFGDSASRQEIKQFLDKMVSAPGLFKSEAAVQQQFENLMKNIQARAFDAAAIIRSQPGGERMVESILSDTDASQGKFTFKRELVK
tara:strand:+ start:106 stop:1383 length:1278 start_codon:yes stop_codon:yes gene_type:complete